MSEKPDRLHIEFNHDNTIVREIGGKRFAFHFELYSNSCGWVEIEEIESTE